MTEKKLHIGDDLKLPLGWIQLATVVYGARGSGKTVLAAVMAEEAHKAGQRFCAIDLKGDLYGLKSSADGKRDGIPVVIFGGDHQDLPLEDTAGKFVGETVAGIAQSCVLDLEHLSKSKQRKLLADFFESLYDHNRQPLLLLLDEAQRYAPQLGGRGIDPALTTCLGAVEDIVKLGRKHGIGVVLFTQRGSGLNKEVSELCDMLVAFRTPGPLDQERIKDWLDANATREQRDEVVGTKDKPGLLAGLDTGTAVFASGHPKLKLFGIYEVRMRETFDSSATPEIGKARREPKKLAEPDLAELRLKMGEAIHRQKAEDPRELRKKIAELEKKFFEVQKENQKKLPPAQNVPLLEKHDRELLDQCKKLLESSAEELRPNGGLGRLLDQSSKAFEHCIKCVLEARVQLQAISNRIDVIERSGERSKNSWRSWTKRDIDEELRPWPKVTNGQGSRIGGGMRRMLIALAQRPQGLSKRQLSLRAGLSSRSGSFATYMSQLRQRGCVSGSGDHLKITPDGLAALGDYDPLPTGQDLLQYWLRELGGGASRMLAVLADAYPKELTREEIGERAEISHRSGSFATYLSKLRTLELVEGCGNELRASEEFFS